MTQRPMAMAAGALAGGLVRVIAAPLVVAGVLLFTIATAAPFGLMMSRSLQSALADQPPVNLGSEEIDADWWLEFRRHARGLEATFTPAVIGFAAPLETLSGMLDGTRRPLAVAAPVAVAVAGWAFLWGGLIQRFSRRRTRGLAAFVRAGLRHWPRCLGVSAAAGLAQIGLYLTVHAALFGPVYSALAAMVERERDAFLIRVVLYLVFGALLAAVALLADYSRIHIVLAGVPLREAVARAAGFLRRSWPAVATLFLLMAALSGAVMAAYGIGEVYGGSRVAGWRGIAIGQAYIVIRLMFRLAFAASEIRLFEQIDDERAGSGVDRA